VSPRSVVTSAPHALILVVGVRTCLRRFDRSGERIAIFRSGFFRRVEIERISAARKRGAEAANIRLHRDGRLGPKAYHTGRRAPALRTDGNAMPTSTRAMLPPRCQPPDSISLCREPVAVAADQRRAGHHYVPSVDHHRLGGAAISKAMHWAAYRLHNALVATTPAAAGFPACGCRSPPAANVEQSAG